MAKVKLNMGMREQLNNFAKNNVKTPQFTKSREIAEAKVMRLLSPFVEKQYPAEHMAILDKHKLLDNYQRIRCVSDGGMVREYILPNEPLKLPHWRTAKPSLIVTKACMSAIETVELKRVQEREAKAEILAKYNGLILASSHAEDLLEVWPGAQKILLPIIQAKNGTLPVPINPTVIDFIKKNNIHQD